MHSHDAHQGVSLMPVRRYLAAQGYPVDPATLIAREEQRLSTLCYLSVDERLLLLRRRKEPFSQFWTAPGGKIEDGEDPLQAVKRELREESNLTLQAPVLKAICSEVGPPGYNWLLFIFACSGFTGSLAESDEGELRWAPVADLAAWSLPDVDRRIMRYALDATDDPHFIEVAYTPEHKVERFGVQRLAAMRT